MEQKKRKRSACQLEAGCAQPKDCSKCGFNKREAARRRRLPLEQGPNGLWRKVIRRKQNEGSDQK